MPRHTRRHFLKQTSAFAAAAATITIAGTKASGKVLGANDAIRVAQAGIHNRGMAHVRQYADIPGVQVTCLVDPDSGLFADRSKTVEEMFQVTPKCVQDIRRMLDDPNVDAVSIAAPNHWHALLTIWACQAGKDVYVEKPCSHDIFEGRKCVEAAQRYHRIVQHGTQQRSANHANDPEGSPSGSDHAKRAAEIAAGEHGKLLVSIGRCYKKRPTIGFKKPTAPPPELDYNIWLGPAPQQPYHANLVHYNWHWFWDTGNGDIGNQGVHEMDVARWMIPNAKLPKSVISLGGRFGYEDQGQTPNTLLTIFDYGDAMLLFEVRGLVKENRIDNEQVFDKNASVTPTKILTTPGVKNPAAPRGPGESNFANFIACVRSRKGEDLDAHILEGHYSAALCHLANMSYRLGKKAPFNKQTGVFGEDKFSSEKFAEMQEHLKDRGVKLAETDYVLGRRLVVDSEKECIVDDDEANQMLRRPGRGDFVIPDKV